jgi:hypothetical protein
MTRTVIVTAETILELMKDYLGEENVPQDARPTRLLFNRNDKGRLAIEASSDNWPTGKDGFEARFDLQRSFLVGGQPSD